MALFWAADTHSDTGNIVTKHVFPRYEGTGKAAARHRPLSTLLEHCRSHPAAADSRLDAPSSR